MNLNKDLSKYANKPIFYVTLDPERALGLEDILPNYTIICPYKSALTKKLRKQSVRVVVLEEYLSNYELEKIVQRGTYGILKSDFVKKHIQDAHDREQDAYILILKNSALIEGLCKKQGWKLLAPKAAVAEKFENKISQYRFLSGVVPYPKTSVVPLVKIYEKVKAAKSQTFVLQFNRGHSGNSTFFIKSSKDLETLAKRFPKREAKISEYIKGKTYTLNCLVLKNGEVITGSLSEQITGLKSATNNPNTTCGNDFASPRKLLRGQIKKIQEISQNTGMALFKKGYRGLFGIDVIIENSSGEVCFIEINTHQPASVSFEAKLHRKIGKVPLLAYFILDSVGAKQKPDKRDLPPILLPLFAKQIIYRNKTSRVLNRKGVERRYKDKGLMSRMKYIKPNEEIFRKQLVR